MITVGIDRCPRDGGVEVRSGNLSDRDHRDGDDRRDDGVRADLPVPYPASLPELLRLGKPLIGSNLLG